MPLNKSKGNMYDFITHTWNPIKGKCYHDCSYCYMTAMSKRFKMNDELRLDEKELKTKFKEDQFIFVGSSTDIFAVNVPEPWISKVLEKCEDSKSKFLFQTKNPERILRFQSRYSILESSIICTTIESNKYYDSIMGNAPEPYERALAMERISWNSRTMVTIEPVMKFDHDLFLSLIKRCPPFQVNIGADSGNNNLPEPSREDLVRLICELEKLTTVHLKTNLKRLMG